MRAEDIDADFVDVWILVPDSGHGQRRSGGAHDGEGGAGGGDAAVLFAAFGVLGGLAGLIALRGRLPASSASITLAVLALAAVFVVLLTVRATRSASANGEIVFERAGVRFREGHAVSDPTRAVTSATSGLNGEAPLWLGERVGKFNLSTVQANPLLLLVYGRCGPAPCSSPVTVMHRWSCGTPPEVEFARSPVETRSDGVVVVINAAGGDERSGLTKAVIWTGHLEVTVYAQREAADANDLAHQLRRVDGQPLAPAASTC